MYTQFARTSLIKSLLDAFKISGDWSLPPRYNIAPTDEIEVIVEIG